MLTFTGERMVPWATEMQKRPDLVQEHLARYLWALSWAAGRDVVDLGCGTGYGSFILSFVANSVWGVDVEPDAIRFAALHFNGRLALIFGALDLDGVNELPAADVYVAFEVLEHLQRPGWVIEMTTGSTLLWSVPVNHDSSFHKHVYSLDQAEALVPGSTIWYQAAGGAVIVKGDPLCPSIPKLVLGVRS